MNDNTIKRPVGMTILLVLSCINAAFQIFGNLTTFAAIPMMRQLLASGELEEMMSPFLKTLQGDDLKAFLETFEAQISINRLYYLFTALLYIGSLVGVIKMFKLDRRGFHIYSIAQILILIVSVVFIYSQQVKDGFFSDFLITALLILLYHLYFKRIENAPNTQREQDI